MWSRDQMIATLTLLGWEPWTYGIDNTATALLNEATTQFLPLLNLVQCVGFHAHLAEYKQAHYRVGWDHLPPRVVARAYHAITVQNLLRQ